MMKILREIDDLALLSKPLHFAIGVFDGLHLGHQAVIRRAVDAAAESDGLAVLISFDPHPRAVLAVGEPPLVLTNGDHKIRLAQKLGIDATLLIQFNEDFASRSGREFIESLVQVSPDLRLISVGAGWKFGSDRSGDFQLLEQLGAEFGFEAFGAKTVRIGDQRVSSTAIREAISIGDFLSCSEMLGREYSVFGEVIRGAQRGRQIGFHTANLAVANEQLPPGGVYVVRADLNGESFGGVANLGVRPTLDDPNAQRLLEVHLFDYSGPEFYGENLEVWFVKFLREERKFESIDHLKAQIELDASSARDALLAEHRD
ncbi:MAG: riboflavin kinase/FMN adenylyltransferase [Verrucomicrobiales bacterium]|jgi:riboflavin kinase/FMN adenylyltransferase